MGFLDKLFGRKKKQVNSTPVKPAAGGTKAASVATRTSVKPASSGSAAISKVYLYVASTVPINAATAEQITTYGLQLLKADPTFRQIMEKMEREKWPTVKGQGTVSSPTQFAPSFQKWLKTKGTSLDQATSVMGKKIFVQGGDAQNPADGSKFSWGLVGCFQ